MPRAVVSMKPFGSFSPGVTSLAMTPRNKSNENDPKNVHLLSPPVLSAFIAIEHTGAQGDVPLDDPNFSSNTQGG